ncbi:acyl-CoA reductase [Alteromonas sp. KUL49]|uniref:acyl-CoA reductase n=1 Tax=Alteromonas sp. KUL49 TaxID=2480798 RepID=UPI00102ED970|nr:acyl-CoA reductase [Alteromonas sp. KUL49]TAP39678.1 hypothetical protein EYS00_10125 [Alteromonas sp. KUL49]GEA11665.1 hypothetical protein KUL49_20400 [Alteromonas sp. KUL49]
MSQQSPVQFQLSASSTFSELAELSPLTVGSSEVLGFLKKLSEKLLRSPEFKPFPEIIALGFWLRDSQVRIWLDMLAKESEGAIIKPVGCVVHYTPNNVDSMFMYSWVCSLLVGNNNIVRLGSADSQAKSLLLEVLTSLFKQAEFSAIAQRNMFIQFDKQSSLNKDLALFADARMLWGGDESVRAIREFSTKPRCRDISFADRYSATIIDVDDNEPALLDKTAQLLWHDTKAHNQLACSSPRVIYWMGSETSLLAFSQRLNAIAQKSDSSEQRKTGQSRCNEHLVVAQLLQMQGIAGRSLINERVCVLSMPSVSAEAMAQHSGDGLFYAVKINSVEALRSQLPDSVQTLTYWGVAKDQLLKLLAEPSIQGVDRCVSLGKALSFTPEWDGYRLFTLLTRHINLD